MFLNFFLVSLTEILLKNYWNPGHPLFNTKKEHFVLHCLIFFTVKITKLKNKIDQEIVEHPTRRMKERLQQRNMNFSFSPVSIKQVS